MLEKYNLQYNKKDITFKVAEEIISLYSKSTQYILLSQAYFSSCRSWVAKIKYDQCYKEETYKIQ